MRKLVSALVVILVMTGSCFSAGLDFDQEFSEDFWLEVQIEYLGELCCHEAKKGSYTNGDGEVFFPILRKPLRITVGDIVPKVDASLVFWREERTYLREDWVFFNEGSAMLEIESGFFEWLEGFSRDCE